MSDAVDRASDLEDLAADMDVASGGESSRRTLRRILLGHRTLGLGVALSVLIALIAAFGPLVVQRTPLDMD
jgi:hypothetical protein